MWQILKADILHLRLLKNCDWKKWKKFKGGNGWRKRNKRRRVRGETSWWIEHHGNVAFKRTPKRNSILARMVLPCVPAVMDYPTTCIHSRTTQELGNVETAVCVLIKSNETNLRSIMRPLERYGNASCRLAPLNCERAHRYPGGARSPNVSSSPRRFIEQSIENITNNRNNPDSLTV